MIPQTFESVALMAVVSQDERTLLDTATQLGLSVPRLVQEALRLAHDPAVVARNPRPCRVLLEREQRAREARSVRLDVRSDV